MGKIRHTILLWFTVLSIYPTVLQAQFFDSISASFQHKPRIDFRIDSRNSFITTRFARIVGIKVGLDFNRTVKIGLGYNQLFSTLERKQLITRLDNKEEEVNSTLYFVYFSPYMEYTFYRKDNWEVSIPVMLGGGFSRYDYRHPDFGNESTPSRLLILYEPYMIGQYRIFKYFGVGAGVGYRLILVGNRAVNENFNSPIYVLKFKVFLGDLYRGIFPSE